jgi:ectoine hydroxylase-related dioxygenase (phytanoyl-CoA dioxygenase family)
MSADVAAHASRVAEQGYSIVEGVLSAEACDAIAKDLGRLERELGIEPANNPFEGTKTIRIYNLLAHGSAYRNIAMHPSVLPIVDEVLDRGCLVSSLSSIAICPGEIGQPLHADDQLIPLKKPHEAIICNTMWAITDFSRENGATRILPGSHQRDGSPNPFDEYDGLIPAEMPKGSVLVYHGSLWHKGGSNKTDARRIGIAMNYCAGFIRQQENQQLGLSRELVATFPPRLRELVGYGVYRDVIGHIDRKNPVGLLDPEADDTLPWAR